MAFEQLKTESYLNKKLIELRNINENSPEFEEAKQETIRVIGDLLGQFMGMIDAELSEDSRVLELLEKAAEAAEFLKESELLERIKNLQEVYE